MPKQYLVREETDASCGFIRNKMDCDLKIVYLRCGTYAGITRKLSVMLIHKLLFEFLATGNVMAAEEIVKEPSTSCYCTKGQKKQHSSRHGLRNHGECYWC
jgi:hypothetical protein